MLGKVGRKGGKREGKKSRGKKRKKRSKEIKIGENLKKEGRRKRV